jgi:hypothetical protein
LPLPEIFGILLKMKTYNTITQLYPTNTYPKAFSTLSESLAWTKDDPWPQVDFEEHGYATMANTSNRKCSRYASRSYTWSSDLGELVQRYELIDCETDCCVGFVTYVENKFYLRGYNPEEINNGRLHFWHLRDVDEIRSLNSVWVFRANGTSCVPN